MKAAYSAIGIRMLFHGAVDDGKLGFEMVGTEVSAKEKKKKKKRKKKKKDKNIFC